MRLRWGWWANWLRWIGTVRCRFERLLLQPGCALWWSLTKPESEREEEEANDDDVDGDCVLFICNSRGGGSQSTAAGGGGRMLSCWRSSEESISAEATSSGAGRFLLRLALLPLVEVLL